MEALRIEAEVTLAIGGITGVDLCVAAMEVSFHAMP